MRLSATVGIVIPVEQPLITGWHRHKMTARGWNRLWQWSRPDAVGQMAAATKVARPLRQMETTHGLPGALPGTDWRWRPASLSGAIQPASLHEPGTGCGFGSELTLWHDCPQCALSVRQLGGTGQPEYALQFETGPFGGEYLSVSMDLPGELLADLGRSHVLRLDGALSAAAPIIVYARLNLVQGPNTASILRQMGDPIDGQGVLRLAEFDLAYADLSSRAMDRAWLDLILQAPGQNIVTLHDLIMSRHPRAQV